METIQTAVAIAKDLITVFAAATAAVVAILGFDTWKRQLTANAEYDLARRVLVAVYRVRDAHQACRLSPGPPEKDETKQLHVAQLTKLKEADTQLEIELLEVEAVWGDNPEMTSALGFLHVELARFGLAYVRYYYVKIDDPNQEEELYQLLFRDFATPDDEISTNIKSLVQSIESVFRPKLRLKQEASRKTWLLG